MFFRSCRKLLLYPLLVVLVPIPAAAQFTIDDVFEVSNASIRDLSTDGRWLFVTVGSLRDRIGIDNYRYGDPAYAAPSSMDALLIDTRTGELRTVLPDRRQVFDAAFSPDGAELALLVREGDVPRVGIYEVAAGRMRMLPAPQGRDLATGTLEWLADGQRLAVAVRPPGWSAAAKARFDHEVHGPIVVRSSEEPFLSWEAIRRMNLQRAPALLDVRQNRYTVLDADSLLGGFDVTADGELLRIDADITEETSYERIFGANSALRVKPVAGGDTRTIHETTEGMRFHWSDDGRTYVYGREGAIFAGTLGGGEERRIAGPARREAADSAAEPADSAARTAERERRRRERFTPVRLSHDGSRLIATNSEGYWLIDVASGERSMFLDAPTGGEDEEEDDERPRWSVAEWSRDGATIYLTEQSRTSWERALHRYDVSSGRRTELLRGFEQIGGMRLSADGSTIVFTRAETNRPSQIWTAGRDFTDARRLYDPNPQLEGRSLAEARLLDYLDADGKKQYGVLYLPADYTGSTPLPTVFLVYEDFFDARFNGTVALLNANGYAVIQPSVSLETGYPGEGWLKGVTAAANRLIDMGIADPDRLGVHGTSYGGYATNLLITQTKRFKAAINISGKVDMISFYTDSPRLGIRNIHAPENSQDRLGATLWEQPHKYIQHSAVMFADRIDTPLLLLTGQQDHNVPERTSSEMFYALRRLGKRVEWVSYIDGGHGMPTTTEAEVRDYHERILGWYDQYLKGATTTAADLSSQR